MTTLKRFHLRPRDELGPGPDSLIGVTEGGKALLALLFCLVVAVALVAAFWAAS
jgi:hypothetical protein